MSPSLNKYKTVIEELNKLEALTKDSEEVWEKEKQLRNGWAVLNQSIFTE